MKETIKIACVGLGRRGIGVLRPCFSEMQDVEITAICDKDPQKVEYARQLLVEKGLPEPAQFTDYEEMLRCVKVDAVVLMTAWKGRVRQAIQAMEAGAYVALEVGGAYDLSECYALVDAYERTKMPAMMLENCCYGRREMAALRMAKEGLFGEIIQCVGGYHHYLNKGELLVKKEDGTIDLNHYRLPEYVYRNCEQYPTHELGPIAKMLNINRGNRMVSLRSFATKGRGLETYIRDHAPEGHPYVDTKFRQGDIITTIIECAGGEQIQLVLDTTLPRPFYSRNFTVRGTKGMCQETSAFAATFYLEGMPGGKEVFNNEEEFLAEHDHPLYKEYKQSKKTDSHGGLDWLVSRAFVESVKRQIQTPIDVYDTAAWMAITPLSEASIAAGGAAVAVPDFTKGLWFSREEPVPCKYSLDLIFEDLDTPI